MTSTNSSSLQNALSRGICAIVGPTLSRGLAYTFGQLSRALLSVLREKPIIQKHIGSFLFDSGFQELEVRVSGRDAQDVVVAHNNYNSLPLFPVHEEVGDINFLAQFHAGSTDFNSR